MKFTITQTQLTEAAADVVALPVFEGGRPLSPAFTSLDRLLERSLSEAIGKEGYKGKVGEIRLIHTQGLSKAGQIAFYGLGPRTTFNAETQRRAMGQLQRAVGRQQSRTLVVELPAVGEPGPLVQASVEGILLGGYSFDRYRSKREPQTLGEVAFRVPRKTGQDLNRALERGTVAAEATRLARELTNTPACDMTPREMVRQAKSIAGETSLKVEVFGREKAKKLGMNAFLAVAQGSEEPPAFLHLTYVPKRKPKERVALVGKGITFDSGGLSLKTPQAMETMKYDMSGAAVVLAVMKGIAALKAPVEVHGFIAATENLPSGRAGKPGDVVRSMSGKTIEVLNTDAEGRLVLADALTYAQKVKPDVVIDIATLTGACVIALGEMCAGVMGNDRALIARLLRSGSRTGEKLWELPLFEEYKEEVKGVIADVKNTGGRYAGTIVGGLFLQEFVAQGTPWAHIDIAGPSWTDKELDYSAKGATGFIVRTLLDFLSSY